MQSDGGGIYITSGDLTMLRCHLSSNIASGSGHAIYFSTSVSRAVVQDTTFVAGAASTGMFIYAGVEVDYGVCAGGRSPGPSIANVLIADGDSFGCPFACPNGTYGVGGGTFVIRNWTNSSGCSFGCWDCPPGAVCPGQGLSAPDWCQAGYYNPDAGSQTESSCRECESGKYQIGNGTTACFGCEAGKYVAAKGQTACEPCAAGGYCEEPGASSASVWTPCEPGR